MTIERPTRVAIVVNPERVDAADELCRALGEHSGIDIHEIRVDDPDQLTDAVRAAVDDGASIVAPVGGDGTQRAAARALRHTDTALAVVPGGTVNLLGQVVGIDDVDGTVGAIVGGRERRFDIGLAGGDPFLLTAGTGYDAAVIRRVDDGAKRFGVLGYFGTAVQQFRRSRPRNVRIHVDGEVCFSGSAMSVLIANVAQRGSSSFRVAVDAAPDDGVLDVVVHRCDSLLGMARTGWNLVRGRRPAERDVVYAQGREIVVEWSAEVDAQVDGDAVGRGRRFEYGIDAGALALCAPPDDQDDDRDDDS